jgi:hypothetical protein
MQTTWSRGHVTHNQDWDLIPKPIVCESMGKGLIVQEEDALLPVHPT